MIDCGKTSAYVLFALDVYLSGMEYLGVDWNSELGKKIHAFQSDICEALEQKAPLVQALIDGE